jgi:outer membrane protein
MKFANPLRLATLAVAALALQPAQANEGPLMVRVRAVHLDSANKDSTGLGLSINNKPLPEVDFSYFLTPNIAAELILTYPQKQDVSSTAHGGKIGTLKHLPPTLTVQYHFCPEGSVRPYVGAGLNYTNFSSVKLPAGFDVDRGSFGAAFQAGVDIPVGKGMYLNLDLKKVYIRTDLLAAGASIGKVKVDPILAGVGIGWRF